MAAATDKTQGEAPANPVPDGGDHDRVVMLSLHADGSVAQHNPEIIGDKDAALELAKSQFRVQAVSAADVAVRGASTDDGTKAEDAPEDPTIERLKKAHESVISKAEKAAEAVVNRLHGSGK